MIIDLLSLLNFSLSRTDSPEVSFEDSQDVLVGLIFCRRKLAHRHMIGGLVEEALLNIGAIELGRVVGHHLSLVSKESHI